jgi:23S rRNA pseudouridine1911/1915/1917 synthase
MNTTLTFINDQDNKTLESILRAQLPGQSWNQIRRLVEARKVLIDGQLCLESARRISKGKKIELLSQSAPKPHTPEAFPIRYLDPHIVVAEKPSGISTVHHPAELEAKETLEPSLQELLPALVARRDGKPRSQLRVVQRLDKETSGLVVFARTIQAERELGEQFLAHTVKRRYFAVAHGLVNSQTISTWMIRDRGDGRRGNSPTEGVGKKAVTHVTVLEQINGYSLLSCVLETGRTHQIRIHLSGIGHPLCGEKVYNKYYNNVSHPDESSAPRLALHALELGFVHPETKRDMFWEMPIPEDLERFVRRLRRVMNSEK